MVINQAAHGAGLNLSYGHSKRIGRFPQFLSEAVGQRAIDSRFNMAGCQFLTVEAYSRGTNSAVGFYSKCDFIAAEEPNPNKETLRMYKTILPLVKYDYEEEE